MFVARLPPHRVAAPFKRTDYRSPRLRKHSPGQEAAIRAEAGNRSVREPAAAYGVSHETVRAILGRSVPAERNRGPRPVVPAGGGAGGSPIRRS